MIQKKVSKIKINLLPAPKTESFFRPLEPAVKMKFDLNEFSANIIDNFRLKIKATLIKGSSEDETLKFLLSLYQYFSFKQEMI